MNPKPETPEDRVQCPGCGRSIKVNALTGQRRIQIHKADPNQPGVCRLSRQVAR